MRRYRYIGPVELKALPPTSRVTVRSAQDVLNWVHTYQPNSGLPVVVTFVVDLQGHLRIAPRQSEHVACAGGEDVLSAGEMTFRLVGNGVEVEAVTNQSTGYCPEPESWPAVAAALERAGIAAPEDFTTKFDFRKCTSCGNLNLVKEAWFYCSICDAPLSAEWNCG